jgi:hypothetical protein
MPADALEIFEWIANALAGWRYLFSPSFRQRTHARWKAEGRGTAFVEILLAAVGMLVTLFLLWLVVSLLRS